MIPGFASASDTVSASTDDGVANPETALRFLLFGDVADDRRPGWGVARRGAWEGAAPHPLRKLPENLDPVEERKCNGNRAHIALAVQAGEEELQSADDGLDSSLDAIVAVVIDLQGGSGAVF
jgi:hypothetical protein